MKQATDFVRSILVPLVGRSPCPTAVWFEMDASPDIPEGKLMFVRGKVPL
ncbi:MAG: hypothetical protein HC941_08440 [Microcoleus sp. SU_5_3]|nr:hypothetical protein [Microcoleus sp. SU_5_3]